MLYLKQFSNEGLRINLPQFSFDIYPMLIPYLEVGSGNWYCTIDLHQEAFFHSHLDCILHFTRAWSLCLRGVYICQYDYTLYNNGHF